MGGNDVARLLMRERIEELQVRMSALPQYEPKTTHLFHGGMYCREVWRDAGVLVIGKVHLREHFYLVLEGTVMISTDDGEAIEVRGPHMFLSRPGCKRAVYSVTAARCMTFHRTDATDVDAAEAELVEEDPASLFDAGNRLRALPSAGEKGVLS